jgi:hypothetical protein
MQNNKPKRRPVNYSGSLEKPHLPPRKDEIVKSDSASILSNDSERLSTRLKDVGTKRSSTLYTKTPKKIPEPISRLFVIYIRNHISNTDSIVEDLVSGTGLKRAGTTTFRRHLRGPTRNIDDAASVDSGKSQRDEITNRIKSVYQELENQKKRNEELESQLKSSVPRDLQYNENHVWKDIQDYTIKIMDSLSVSPSTINDLNPKLEKETIPQLINIKGDTTESAIDCTKRMQKEIPDDLSPKHKIFNEEIPLPQPKEMKLLLTDAQKETNFDTTSFLNDVLAQFNFQ